MSGRQLAAEWEKAMEDRVTDVHDRLNSATGLVINKISALRMAMQLHGSCKPPHQLNCCEREVVAVEKAASEFADVIDRFNDTCFQVKKRRK